MNRLKLIDTYTVGSEGVFEGFDTASIISQSETETVAVNYYLSHSGDKYVSPLYNKMYEITGTYVETNTAIAELLLNRYSSKWLKIKEALIDSTYSPLMDYEHTENRTKSYTDEKTATGSATTDGTHASKETNTNERTNEDGIYGFNSSVSVPSSTSSSSSESVTSAQKADNTTHGETSTEGSESLKHTETDSLTKSGRNTSGAELVEKELDLRSKAIYLDIIYKDIDSMLTLSVYD